MAAALSFNYETVPSEIWKHVFSFLDTDSLLKTEKVCLKWQTLVLEVIFGTNKLLEFKKTYEMNCDEILKYRIKKDGISELSAYKNSVFSVRHHPPREIISVDPNKLSEWQEILAHGDLYLEPYEFKKWTASYYTVIRLKKGADLPLLNTPVDLTQEEFAHLEIFESGYSSRGDLQGYYFEVRFYQSGNPLHCQLIMRKS